MSAKGIRVPEDTAVTGFDGTITAYLSDPQLTTCDSDHKGQAELILQQIRRFYETGEPETVCTHAFRPVFSGSCGCPENTGEHRFPEYNRQQSEMLYNIDNTMFYQVDQMMVEKDLYAFLHRRERKSVCSTLLSSDIRHCCSAREAIPSTVKHRTTSTLRSTAPTAQKQS